MAANSLGEEKRPAQGRGVTPARIAALVALAVVVIALLAVLLGGNGSYRYTLMFQNAAQLVNGNEVMIGGQPVGAIDSIDLADDNQVKIEIEIEQQLHEGSSAVVRATSLSGVANHYISISPGPNSNAELEDGAVLGLDKTTTAVDLDQFLNTFPDPVRRSLGEFLQGNATQFSERGKDANRTFEYFAPALNRAGAFVGELNADQHLLERFVVSSSKLATAVAERGEQLSGAIANASTAMDAIASQNEAFSETLRLLPSVFRESNTTFVNLRAALDDLDPLVATAKPATKDLAPFLRELRPVLDRVVPTFTDLRYTTKRKGFANDAVELLGFLPAVEQRASVAFPRAEQAIEDFLPSLSFARAYTPDIFNGFGKLGQLTAYYDGNGHYARVSPIFNLFQRSESGQLDAIPPSQQYDVYGSPSVKRPCPGAATQPAPDGSNPFTEPPFAGSGVTPQQCNPADVPAGP